MKLVRKVLSALGGIFLAAFLIAALAPKAAHAIVATLVQVVNTPTTAIPTVQAPAETTFYSNSCSGTYLPHDAYAYCTFPPLPVPSDSLVVESVTINSVSSPGADVASAQFCGTDFNLCYFVPMIKMATYPSPVGAPDNWTGSLGGRIYFQPNAGGITPGCQVNVIVVPNAGGISCTVSGYLVPSS
jgi:hypothetical protein